MIFKIDFQVFQALHITFYEIFCKMKIQQLVNTYSTFVDFKAISHESQLNLDYVKKSETQQKKTFKSHFWNLE